MLRTALVAACLAATASVSRAATCASAGVTSSDECNNQCSGYAVKRWLSSVSGGVTTESCTCDPSTLNVQICSGTTVAATEAATDPPETYGNNSASSTTMAAAAAVGVFVAYVL
jgi:hypothetical protein